MSDAAALSHARIEALRAQAPRVDLYADTFPQQRAFCSDTATFATADCGRRSGKSEGIARYLLDSERKKPRAPALYFTTTRADAKRIMWEPLLALNKRHGLGLEPSVSTLTLRRNGVDRIYLTGCNNQTEIGKMRGSGWGAVAGDEAQNFPAYLKPLVEESLTPALMDFDGSLRLAGTPAPVPVGYFYECSRSPKWSHHGWTPFDNPHVKAHVLLAKVLELRGITAEHPSIQREFYGRWVYDSTALVFAWDAARNSLIGMLPPLTDYVIGVDLGFDDADAIAVLGWQKNLPGLYLVEEFVLAKQSITSLAGKLRELHEKYSPLRIVVDTGGLGKKIADEIQRRTGIPLEAADKARKLEHIELLNDALRTGNFFARADSRMAQDTLLVEWDRTNPEKPKISERFHSDILDAVLYGFMRALHWLHEPAVDAPAPGSDAAIRAEEERMEEDAESAFRARQEVTQEYGSYRG